MMCSGLHDDFDNPPNVPAFSGNTSKRPRRESLSEAISGAAVAIAETIKGSSPCPPPPQLPTGISPGKAVDLRMKNFEQLRFLQKLYEDGILSEHEFLEQKGNILSSLLNILICANSSSICHTSFHLDHFKLASLNAHIHDNYVSFVPFSMHLSHLYNKLASLNATHACPYLYISRYCCFVKSLQTHPTRIRWY